MGNIAFSNFFKLKKKYIVKKSFKDTSSFKLVLKYIYPPETSKIYAFYQKLISKAMYFFSVEDIWNVKLLFCCATLMLLITVTNTNIQYKSDEAITTIQDNSSILFSSDATDKEKLLQKEIAKQNEKKLFYKVLSKFNYDEIKKDEANAINNIAIYLEINNLVTNDEPTDDVARRIYGKINEYYSLRETDYLGWLILIVFSFFLPDAYLYFRSYMMKFYIYNEYLKLEVTAIMVGKLEPIKVEEILNVLSDNSKYFKRYIDEIRYNYFNVKDGNSKAFTSVIAKVAHKELRYLLKALQQASESDLKMTIENLENQRKSNKEFRSIKEQNKLKKKELVGILVILIVLAAVCVYSFAPFEYLMNNFSI